MLSLVIEWYVTGRNKYEIFLNLSDFQLFFHIGHIVSDEIINLYVILYLSFSFSLSYMHCISIDTLEMKCKRWVVVVISFCFIHLFLFLQYSPDTHTFEYAHVWYCWELWLTLSSLFISSDSRSYVSTVTIGLCIYLCVCACDRVYEGELIVIDAHQWIFF